MWQLFFFVLGLMVGSFINAAEYRLRKSIPIFSLQKDKRSFCDHCHRILTFIDLIPVVSFLLFKGRCRACKKLLTWQYPLIELLTAATFTLTVSRFGMSFKTFVAIFFTSGLIFIFLYDLKYKLIEDRVAIPLIIIAALLNYFVFNLSLTEIGLGMGVGGIFFAAQYFVSKGKWIGSGDIRLGVLMGVMLGWEKLLVAIILGYLFGAFIAILLLILKKAKLKTELPLGAFLTPAAYVGLLWGDVIIKWYWGLL